MMLEESTETGIGRAVPAEITTQLDDRLARLQTALSDLTRVRQLVAPQASSVEVSLSMDDKPERLEAALRMVSENYSGLEQVITDSTEQDDLADIRLDDTQTALVLEHMELAGHLARRYTNRGEPIEDLQQVAAMGLTKAAARFDPERGILFATFAGVTIEGEIKRYFRDKTWSIKVPRSTKETRLRVNSIMQELTHKLGRHPTTAEIAEELEIGEDAVMDAFMVNNNYRAASLDAPTGPNNDDVIFQDSVGQEDTAYEGVGNKLLVEELLATLEPREAIIMRARAGLPPFLGEHAQAEIAEILGVSQVHVSRLERNALLKLGNLVTEIDFAH